MKKVTQLSIFLFMCMFALMSCKKKGEAYRTSGEIESISIDNKFVITQNDDYVNRLECFNASFTSDKQMEVELNELTNGNEIYDFKFSEFKIASVSLEEFSAEDFEGGINDLSYRLDSLELYIVNDEDELLVGFGKNSANTILGNNQEMVHFISHHPTYRFDLKMYFDDQFEGERSFKLDFEFQYTYSYKYDIIR